MPLNHQMKRFSFYFALILLIISLALLVTMNTSANTARFKQVRQNGKDTTTIINYTTPSNSVLPFGYFVVNRFKGQQGAVVRGLGSLQCLARSFSLPVRILQPFAVGSFFTSNLHRSNLSAALQFGDFFNLQIFNEFSELESEPTLAPWTELLVSAPREVIVVRITSSQENRNIDKRIKFQLLGDTQAGTGTKDLEVDTKNGVLCFSEAYMENKLLSDLDFCVVRVVNLEIPTQESSLEGSIYECIYNNWNPKKTTVVLTQWCGNIWAQNRNAFDRVNCSDPDWNRIEHKLAPSKRLLKDTQFYIRRHFHSPNFVAVMVRSEHVISGFLRRKEGSKKNLLDYVKHCLQSAIETAYSELSNNHTPQREPDRDIILTLDVGKEGSTVLANKLTRFDVLGQNIDDAVREMVGDVYNNKLSFEDWENSFIEASGEIVSPAYIAALQRTIASQSDCLILVGGGNFQMLATIEYLKLHPNPQQQCVHMVCFKDWYTPIFNSHLTV